MQNNKQSESQKEAQEHVREQWEEKNHGNPHQSAHFGSYAFKPINVLNSIDEGINSITGNVIRLEGHTQNDVMFSEASQSLLVSKFGKMKCWEMLPNFGGLILGCIQILQPNNTNIHFVACFTYCRQADSDYKQRCLKPSPRLAA